MQKTAPRRTSLETIMDSQNRCLIPGLPDEIGTRCLARIPLSDRQNFTAVCKSWRSLPHRKMFWDVRRELSISEVLLLIWTLTPCRVNVWYGFYPSANKWFQLPPMPDDNRIKGTSTFAVVDDKLFVIGGKLRGSGDNGPTPPSIVSYLDMRNFEWKVGAPLNVARAYCMAGVINKQLYVCGGIHGTMRRFEDATDTAEVYNPSTPSWRFISSMKAPMSAKVFYTSTQTWSWRFPSTVETPMSLASSMVIDDKFYVVNIPEWTLEGMVYDSRKDEWTEMSFGLNQLWCGKPIEFSGKMCIYESLWDRSDNRQAVVIANNQRSDCWELIHGSILPPAERSCSRGHHKWGEGEQLVNLCGTLYTVQKCGFWPHFEIKDLKQKLIASRDFNPRSSHGSLLSGANLGLYYDSSEYDFLRSVNRGGNIHDAMQCLVATF